MHSRRHKPGGGGLLKWLFLCSLIFCVCLNQVSLTTWQAKFVEEKTAQVRDLSGSFREVCKRFWGETTLRNFGSQAYAASQHEKSGLDASTEDYGQLLSLDLLQDLILIEVPSTNASQHINQGIESYTAGDFKDAIKQWQKALTFYQKTHKPFPVEIINNLARAYQQIGESELAIAYWEQAIAYYRQIKDLPQVGRRLTQEAQAYNSLGQTAKAIALADSALEIASTYKDIPSQAAALGSRGEAYRLEECNLKLVNSNKPDLLKIGKKTAIFNSIILENHAAIIVSFPSGYKKLSWINIDRKTFTEEVNKFRIGLENYGDIIYNPKQAQKLYDWIVHPFASDLERLQIKTLVFIQDGILRSVPMAALHDGEKFLVEKYAIATTPSLALTNPQTVHRKKLRALAVGLTKDAIVDGRRYEALNNVASEIRQVEEQIPGSKRLLDENFTRDRLQAELRQTVYDIIHIATHGEFGNFPEDTFLVTGDNDKLTITELYSMIRSLAYGAKTIDLLTLTACDTAIGDDRAALGIAGVAVQAGVRTALASLWSIDDASTVELVTKFYQAWRRPGVSKAEALRKAQQALISNGRISAHPAYWAAFILIGDWL